MDFLHCSIRAGKEDWNSDDISAQWKIALFICYIALAIDFVASSRENHKTLIFKAAAIQLPLIMCCPGLDRLFPVFRFSLYFLP